MSNASPKKFNPVVLDDTLELPPDSPAFQFNERRINPVKRRTPGVERRQFSNSYDDLSAEASELGKAIDAYKLEHHRRFVNFEELLTIIKSLGYHRD